VQVVDDVVDGRGSLGDAVLQRVLDLAVLAIDTLADRVDRAREAAVVVGA
jgi:hypothetical protein